MRFWTGAAAAAVGTVAALAFAGAVQAGHNPPSVDIGEPGECGQVTVTSTAAVEATHALPANAKLVVEVDGEVHVAAVGDEITVGPFDADVMVRARIFGGGERDYDVPAWNGYGDATFVADINAYGAVEGWDWTVGGGGDPFTTWLELGVEGCPKPEPTTTPTADPTASPSVEPSADPSVEPTAAPGSGGGGELAQTGMPVGALWVLGAGLVAAGIAFVAISLQRRKDADLGVAQT